MATKINRLNATFVRTTSKVGLHADGGGLYLSTKNGGRRWLFVFRFDGRRKEMGLGSATAVSLARARELAAEARALVAEGVNPIEARNVEPAAIPTFGAFASSYVDDVEGGWRNPKHRQQWRNSLTQHAAKLQSIPVDRITTQDVLDVLRPIWLNIPETASRVRGRIEKVLAAAMARGLRPQDAVNPGKLQNHLQLLLPKQPSRVRHHAALPYGDVPALWPQLALRRASSARALEFLILTAARSGEVLGAKWREIQGDLWIIPSERMKAKKPHTVTLSRAALAILDSIGRGKPDAAVFKGQGEGGHLSVMVLEMLMRRMDYGSFTPHGFRSSFKDWAMNKTDFPDELSEEALAHTFGSKVRQAYRREKDLERRRALMEAWAAHVTGGAIRLAEAA